MTLSMAWPRTARWTPIACVFTLVLAACGDGGNAPGGTTTVVFDPDSGGHLHTIPSLSGTVRNCAGGPTPWNSWLSCEETLDGCIPS